MTNEPRRKREPGQFADAVTRLAGLHALSYIEFADLIGLTSQTISLWRGGREPSVAALSAIASFFEIDSLKMATTPFEELLPTLADRARFKRVETKIAKSRAQLRLV